MVSIIPLLLVLSIKYQCQILIVLKELFTCASQKHYTLQCQQRFLTKNNRHPQQSLKASTQFIFKLVLCSLSIDQIINSEIQIINIALEIIISYYVQIRLLQYFIIIPQSTKIQNTKRQKPIKRLQQRKVGMSNILNRQDSIDQAQLLMLEIKKVEEEIKEISIQTTRLDFSLQNEVQTRKRMKQEFKQQKETLCESIQIKTQIIEMHKRNLKRKKKGIQKLLKIIENYHMASSIRILKLGMPTKIPRFIQMELLKDISKINLVENESSVQKFLQYSNYVKKSREIFNTFSLKQMSLLSKLNEGIQKCRSQFQAGLLNN